jgi:AraC-like DNA-binding protein
VAFDFVTKPMSKSFSLPTHKSVLEIESVPRSGSARISVVWHLPGVLQEFGVDIRDVLAAAGVRADIFGDRDNLIAYPDYGRLLRTCEERTGCDHVMLLVTQRAGLTDMGLAGQVALCGQNAGDGLRALADHFNLQSSASTISVIEGGDFARLVYAISEPGMSDTRQLQLGAMVIGLNILRDLCGQEFLPTVVTFASRAPDNLRPCQKFFQSPLRFDSDESALVFERHWLDRPLAPVGASTRRRIRSEVRVRRASILADFPATVRRILRKQLLLGDYSMEQVAGLVGMHRRTLDRRLQRQGVHFGQLLDSVKGDVAKQLLRDTGLQVQHIA